MITAVHTLLYAEDPDAARDFLRDVLQFPSVDSGGGWLIFRTGPSETGPELSCAWAGTIVSAKAPSEAPASARFLIKFKWSNMKFPFGVSMGFG